MQNSLIDVIVPVYNGEKYVSDIFESFEHQTFKAFRIIFVNDGSTDNTGSLLLELCAKASFETLIVTQENKGLPGARNTGIKNATAKWISFVDSDDYVMPEFLEYLYETAQKSKSHLVYGNYYMQDSALENQLSTAGNRLLYKVMPAEDVIYEHFSSRWIAVTTLLVDREWLSDNGLMFDDKCLLLEDNVFLMTTIARLETVGKVENNIYLYRVRKNSLLHTTDTTKYYAAYDGFDRMGKDLSTLNTAASKMYFTIGQARFSVALLRRAAKQLSLDAFLKFANTIPYKEYSKTNKNLPLKYKLVGYVFIFSKKLFYRLMRL